MTEQISREATRSNTQNAATAGLRREGWYEVEWKSHQLAASKTRTNPETGETYGGNPVIKAVLKVVSFARFDQETGDLAEIVELDPTSNEFQTFPTQGKGESIITSFYQSATGQMPSGDEDGEFYWIDKAEDLIGTRAWNRGFHTRPDEAGRSYFNFTRTFRSQPPAYDWVIKKRNETRDGQNGEE